MRRQKYYLFRFRFYSLFYKLIFLIYNFDKMMGIINVFIVHCYVYKHHIKICIFVAIKTCILGLISESYLVFVQSTKARRSQKLMFSRCQFHVIVFLTIITHDTNPLKFGDHQKTHNYCIAKCHFLYGIRTNLYRIRREISFPIEQCYRPGTGMAHVVRCWFWTNPGFCFNRSTQRFIL